MTRFRERAALRGSAWTALVFFTLIVVTGAVIRISSAISSSWITGRATSAEETSIEAVRTQ